MIRDLLLRTSESVKNADGIGVKGATSLGRRQPARCAMKQSGSEMGLQRRHLLADRSLRYAEDLGGRGEAVMLDDRAKLRIAAKRSMIVSLIATIRR